MQLLYDRLLETAASITSDPAPDPRTPIEWLYDTTLTRYVNWVLSAGAIEITIDFDSAVMVDAVGVAGHNFSSSATISVNGSTAVPLEPTHALVMVPEATDTQFVITIADPAATGSDERIIGRLEIGSMYVPPVINDNLTVSEISNSALVLSSSRQAYGYRRTSYTRATVQFPVIEADEVRELMAFYQYVDVFVPFFVTFDEDCLDANTNYAILEESATLPLNYQYSTESKVGDHFWTSTLTMSEVY